MKKNHFKFILFLCVLHFSWMVHAENDLEKICPTMVNLLTADSLNESIDKSQRLISSETNKKIQENKNSFDAALVTMKQEIDSRVKNDLRLLLQQAKSELQVLQDEKIKFQIELDSLRSSRSGKLLQFLRIRSSAEEYKKSLELLNKIIRKPAVRTQLLNFGLCDQRDCSANMQLEPIESFIQSGKDLDSALKKVQILLDQSDKALDEEIEQWKAQVDSLQKELL